jgi:hypothetical protein
MADLAIILAGKKYMWDKGVYTTEAEARDRIARYEEDGFETHLIKEDKDYLVYSRRLVTEIVLEGEPPV